MAEQTSTDGGVSEMPDRTHRGGYGTFKVNAAKEISKENARALAEALEFKPAEKDGIEHDPNAGLALICKMEDKGLLSESSIDQLVNGMREINLDGIASKINEEYSKIQTMKEINISDHVIPEEVLPKREMFPFFSDEDFDDYSHFNKEKLDEYHLENKRKYEKRIKMYTLPGDCDIKCSDAANNTRHLVLLGKTGDGKSSTANTILGGSNFNVSQSANSETSSSSEGTGTYKNRKIKVVDTPGVHDTKQDYESVQRELKKVAFLMRDGVHCFIICMKASDTKFTKETEEMLEIIKMDDRGSFLNFCMLALTNADSELKKCSLEELLARKKDNTVFKDFLESICDRVVAVNNTTDIPAENERNREVIIAMVDKVVRQKRNDNEPNLYTNELFQLAGELYDKLKFEVTTNNYPPGLVDDVVEAVIALSDEGKTAQNIETHVINMIQSASRPEPIPRENPEEPTLYSRIKERLKKFLNAVATYMKRIFSEHLMSDYIICNLFQRNAATSQSR